MRPRYVWFENVEGIISAKTADGESVLKYVLGDLEERGYSCTWGVFSASEVGAPHQRKRVFILGKLSNTNIERLEREASERVQRREGRREQCQVCEPTGSSGQVSETELGNAKHDGSPTTKDRGSTRSEQEEGRLQEPTGRCEQSEYELGDTSSERSCRGSTDEGKQRTEMFRQGYESTESQGDNNGTSDVAKGLGKTEYPARPGQQQYEWEEPRVVAYSKHKRSVQSEHSARRREELSKDGESARRSTETQPNCEAQSCVGLSANGTAFRVDELRLLGNGVVPDTCELAFKTLIQQL